MSTPVTVTIRPGAELVTGFNKKNNAYGQCIADAMLTLRNADTPEARARADAYAGAAGLKIDRVLTIRDGGDGAPPMPYYEMDAAANQAAPQAAAAPAPFNPGVSESQVSVRVDFALSEK